MRCRSSSRPSDASYVKAAFDLPRRHLRPPIGAYLRHMCIPTVTSWTPAVTFLAGAATAIFAEPLRQWIFRPVLEVSFEPGTCNLSTPTTVVGITLGAMHQVESQGRYVRVRVRTTTRRIAKGCRAYLVKIEVEEQGTFHPSNFVDTLRLKWSSQLADEATKPLDIPKDVSQFVDALSTDIASPNQYVSHTTLMPQYCRQLFDQRPKTLRLTILVTSDDAKPARARFIFRWKGTWDTFEASPG
jgi:hypothetical protein